MVRFTRKKIDSLTLGERLQKIRTERRLSLAEVAKSTKIQVKYLTYLEEGEYLKLPADVYVRGFLKSYAAFMGMNENALIKQFMREKGIQRNIKKTDGEEKIRKPINFSSFVLTPKIIIVSSIAIFVVGCFFYLYREVNSFVSSPRLFILNPVDGATINDKAVRVEGKAEKDSILFINDQPVLVNEKGEFAEEIGLKGGLNKITVKAKNRFDRESEKSVSVNAQYQNATENSEGLSEQAAPIERPFKMEVSVKPNSTWLSVEADGNLVYSGVLQPGQGQVFEVKDKISITSGKGKETFLKINDKDLGTLSGDNGPAKDILFNVDGRI